MRVEVALLDAAKAGDPAAMHALLVRVQPDIRRYAAYHCNRATAIDDVVQEALVIVNRRVSSLRNVAAFGAWLARVILRLCVRPALRLLGASSLEPAERSIDFASRPPDELRGDVARALESLPEMYRVAVVLRDFEELSITELAERLGLTREAAKSRLHRARAMVREYLVAET